MNIKELTEKIKEIREKTMFEEDKQKKINELLEEAKKEMKDEEIIKLLRDGRPPREWSDDALRNFYGASWEECIARAERGGADNPEAFCGAIRAEKRRRGIAD